MNEKKSTLKVIIFLLIFAIIAVGITFVLVKLKTTNKQEIVVANEQNVSNNSNQQIESKKIPVKEGTPIQINDLFTINNLKFEMNLYENGDSWQEKEMNYATNQYEYTNRKYEEVYYVQIDGLKNKEIQSNVNRKIENIAKGMLLNKTNDGIWIYTEVNANFNNILSIRFYQEEYSKGNGHNTEELKQRMEWNVNAEDKFLNIDLTTGNELKIEDLFIKGTDIKNIISGKLFNYFMGEYGSEGGPAGTYNYNLHAVGHGDDFYPYEFDCFGTEDKVFEAMNEFNKKENPKFYIKESGDIYLDFEKIIGRFDWPLRIELALKDIYTKVNYKAFISEENIYDGKYNEDLTVWGINTSVYLNYLRPNLLLITDREGARCALNCLNGNELAEVKEKNEQKIEKAKKIVEYEKEYANNNLDKMNILMFGCDWEMETFNSSYALGELKLEISKQSFDNEKFLKVLLEEIKDSIGSGKEALYEFDFVLTHYNETFTNISDVALCYGNGSDKINTYEMLQKYYEKYSYYDKITSEDCILPSNKQLLEKSKLENLNEDELTVLRNELFARHGHDFKTPWLKEVFYNYDWYPITYGKSVSVQELNEIERENLKIIDEVIASKSN